MSSIERKAFELGQKHHANGDGIGVHEWGIRIAWHRAGMPDCKCVLCHVSDLLRFVSLCAQDALRSTSGDAGDKEW